MVETPCSGRDVKVLPAGFDNAVQIEIFRFRTRRWVGKTTRPSCSISTSIIIT